MEASSAHKPRLFVLTDIGGDPDDEQTLIRLLVHANEFDIEGIVPEHWRGHRGRHGDLSPSDQMNLVREILRRYGQVRDSLRQHADGYPAEAHLSSVLKRGKAHVPFALDTGATGNVSHIIGPGMDTAASDWLISVVDRPDPRPVDVNVWV